MGFIGPLTCKIHVHGLFNALLAPLYAGSTVSYCNRAFDNIAVVDFCFSFPHSFSWEIHAEKMQ